MFPVSSRAAAHHAMAATALLLLPRPAGAQAAAPPAAAEAAPDPAPLDAPLDPASPLAPLPDLGVAWPDLATPDVPVAADTATAGVTAPAPPPKPAAADAERTEHYRVTLVGADDLGDAFRTRFDQLSALIAGDGKAANAAQIDRRARDDEALLRQLLRAAGRYDGAVTTEVATAADGTIAVRLVIDPGTAYRFTAVTLPGLEAAGAQTAALRADFAIEPGATVDADAVIAAVAAFRAALGHRGYPFAKVAEPDVTVDHETHGATLALAVTPGAQARIGRITTTGPRPVFSTRHLGDISRLHAGDLYDAALIDDFRRALIATGLVSTVTITPIATADPAVVDLAVRIDRAPPRTIAGELGYGTGEGFRVEASWQHRNLIGPEGAMTFRGVAGTREQSLGASLRRSNFHSRDQVLTGQIVASHTNLNAYDARTFTLAGGLERQTNIIWQKKWTWSFGGELLASDERDTIVATGQPRRRTFLVAAAPTSLAYDGSDDLLNPTRGYRLAGRLSPEASLQNGADFYLKAQIDGSVYYPVAKSVSIAGRFRLATIAGAPRDSIAPSRRYYAGGGGSVRGYSYQKIGLLDVNGDPIGGRALNEFSLEARVRFGDFGVVPFLDAGNLYASSLPRLTGLRYGTGLGVRYYSSFGPIRVDVGTPIARRKGEARVAVYVSLGQAF